MRFRNACIVGSILLIGTTLPALANPKVHRGPGAPKLIKPRIQTTKPKNTASIDPERATQIQTALVKAGYLTGTPSGVWDSETQAAMEKLQADNGWQTKLVPDARAIIHLGLGPAGDAVASSNLDLQGTQSTESGETPTASSTPNK